MGIVLCKSWLLNQIAAFFELGYCCIMDGPVAEAVVAVTGYYVECIEVVVVVVELVVEMVARTVASRLELLLQYVVVDISALVFCVPPH